MFENTGKALSRRRFVQLGSGLAGAALLAACGDNTATTAPAPAASVAGAVTTTAAAPAPAGPLKKIKFAVPTAFILSYMETYIAKEGKFWEKEGLDVELVAGSGTASSLQQVSTKTAFAARGGAITTIINRANQSVPIRSVYPIYRGVQFVIITNDKAGIKTPADMKGKNLGVVSRNGSTEQLLTLILSGASVKKDDWNPVVVGAAAGAYAFLEKGDVAAFTATNHVAVELQFTKQPVTILPMSNYLKVPSDDVIVHQDSIKEDPDTISRLLRGLHTARKWALEPANLDKIVDYLKPYVPDEARNVELARLKIQSDLANWTGAGTSFKMGQLDKAGWTSLQDQLQTGGFIQKKLELADLIDTSFMEKIEP